MRANLKKFVMLFILVACVIILFDKISYSSEINKKNFYHELSKRLSKNRADYSNLSNEEFANFRAVISTGITTGKLYRSSSPVKAWGNRDIISDNAANKAGVKTFINLADSEKDLKARKNFNQKYYSRQKFICLNLNLKFKSKNFQNALARGFKFMAENDPPFLIHCDLGKDRAGLFCALIECLAGASADEVVNDFMISFYNYFGIIKNSDEYEFIADNEIKPFLASILEVKNIYDVNLYNAAEKYFLKIGVSQNEINTLRQKLK